MSFKLFILERLLLGTFLGSIFPGTKKSGPRLAAILLLLFIGWLLGLNPWLLVL